MTKRFFCVIIYPGGSFSVKDLACALHFGTRVRVKNCSLALSRIGAEKSGRVVSYEKSHFKKIWSGGMLPKPPFQKWWVGKTRLLSFSLPPFSILCSLRNFEKLDPFSNLRRVWEKIFFLVWENYQSRFLVFSFWKKSPKVFFPQYPLFWHNIRNLNISIF